MKKELQNHLSKQIADSMQSDFSVQSIEPVYGGDINQAYSISGQKQKFFVKLNSSSRFDMFEAEAKGLKQIEDSHTIKVPNFISCGVFENHSFLILEWLNISKSGDMADVAVSLAKMHKTTSKNFGFASDNFIGSTPQINQWKSNWIDFFAENRLKPQLQWLKEKGVAGRIQNSINELTSQLDRFFIDYNPEPSLIHGDLWQGNYGFNLDGIPVIYDPACYYGDFEADLAMMELFGNPGELFFSEYNKHNPNDEGYAVRKNIYNLYHLLNHANLFGSSYLTQIEMSANRLLKIF